MNTDKNITAEILAPAGSYESFEAAVNAGADAIYLGGASFGARAFAGNFEKDELLKAIDAAHIHNRKIYLTVNTLFKNNEIYDELYNYLLPYYKEGLDAVIVQDLGAFDFIRTNFPDMAIHASTQMTISGLSGAKLIKEMGGSRIVTARELSLKEIKNIHDNVDIEIESFVHGALCYCYSGQCLLSSFIGGRSGNRGRCAQPCRLMYNYNNNSKYYLSPKDMNALSILPEIIESGVYSLKIEGRMKKPWYTAGVVAAYRKYLDYYLEHGKKGYKVSEEDMNNLSDLYNRGGFTKGYYLSHNGRDMMSVERPNHQGIKVGNVIERSKKVKIKLSENINEGDVLELRMSDNDKIEWTEKVPSKKGSIIEVNCRNPKRILSETVYRTRNNTLIDKIDNDIIKSKPKEKIKGYLKIYLNKPVMLTIETLSKENRVTVSGEVVSEAKNKPMDKQQIIKQMNKMGNTPFEFAELEIDMEDNIFIPVSQLNDLRRNAVLKLTESIFDRDRRKCEKENPFIRKNILSNKKLNSYGISVYTENEKHINMLLSKKEISRIYLDMGVMQSGISKLSEYADIIKKSGREAYLALPHILRDKAVNNIKDNADLLEHFDGIMVRNIDELSLIKEIKYSGNIIGDYSLYAYNDISKNFLGQYGVKEFTMPVELNYNELKGMDGNSNGEIIVYGYQVTMISAQCVVNTDKGCSKSPGIIKMTDRMKNSFFVRNNCKYCYNTIYNTLPTSLYGNINEIDNINSCERVRINLTVEDEGEAEKILDGFIKKFYYRDDVESPVNEFTRGHFKRGVE